MLCSLGAALEVIMFCILNNSVSLPGGLSYSKAFRRLHLVVIIFILFNGFLLTPARGGELRPQLWVPYLTTSSRPTLHHDPSSSDHTPLDTPSQVTLLFHALQGTAIMNVATVNDERGLAYVTSGKTDQPCLHAFYLKEEDGHQAGDVAWTSNDWENETKLGTTATISSPIIDNNGDVYINDDRFLWASTWNGRLKWKASLPRGEDEDPSPLITPVFTPSGHVGGITGKGWVRFYDRDTGAIKATYQLSGLAQSNPASPSLSRANSITNCLCMDTNDQPMIDPLLLEKSFAPAFFGVGPAVANTPAVLPEPDDQSGSRCRIYIPATLSSKDENGNPDVKLFRLDITYDKEKDLLSVEENRGFNAIIKGGLASATSPDISADGQTITFGTNNGYLSAVKANTGEIRWNTKVGAMYGSATITWSDPYTVYIGAGSTIKAINGTNGRLLWTRNYNFLATQELPAIQVHKRVAIVDGLILDSPNTLQVPFLLGYKPSMGPSREGPIVNTALWPMKAVLVILDKKSGKVKGVSGELPDSSEGESNVDYAGNVHLTFFSSISSLAHCLWRNHSLDLGVLPEPMKPVGGFAVFSEKTP